MAIFDVSIFVAAVVIAAAEDTVDEDVNRVDGEELKLGSTAWHDSWPACR